MKYYVYHIKGVKVGCTKNAEARICQQGYTSYEILKTTSCIDEASEAEVYFQKKLGYKTDRITYKQKITQKKMLHITDHTITFKNTYNESLEGFKFPSIIDLGYSIIYLTDEIKDFLIKNNHKSQFNDNRYVYTNSLIAFDNESKAPKNGDIFNSIRDWAETRGVYAKGDPKTQYLKLQEECGELAEAILKEDQAEITDAIGDIVVVLTNLAKLQGLKIEDCIVAAYNVIKSRKGKMENGTFVKD